MNPSNALTHPSFPPAVGAGNGSPVEAPGLLPAALRLARGRAAEGRRAAAAQGRHEDPPQKRRAEGFRCPVKRC